VFTEKTLKGLRWKRVEVQIVGDGQEVAHVWERECSVQRRFQKISSLPRTSIQRLIDSAVKMATTLNYKGLGTFKFLVNVSTKQWAFLEINPRVQVEPTVTGSFSCLFHPLSKWSDVPLAEKITNIDLVQTQLLLSLPNNTLSCLSLSSTPQLPVGYAIQLRLIAEDPTKSFRLSPGTIRAEDITWPSGRSIRIDTSLSSLQTDTFTVSMDVDSLLATIAV
ncbi:pyruvate carboxylase, partial [Marasmius crinis-equi]